MASPLARVLARFEARVHNTKNRLVAIPADVQRQLRLVRQVDNHLLCYSIRPKGNGRWNHHWAQLTFDNEFSVPADVAHIDRGCLVEIKVHRLVKNIDALEDRGAASGGADLLLAIAGAGEVDMASSRDVDSFLYGDA